MVVLCLVFGSEVLGVLGGLFVVLLFVLVCEKSEVGCVMRIILSSVISVVSCLVLVNGF